MLLTLTPERRRALAGKRLALGLSTRKLARILGVSDMTLARWENGPTRYCIHVLSPIVADFLAGNYDEKLAEYGSPHGECQGVCRSLRLLAGIYLKSREYPEVRSFIVEGLRRLAEHRGFGK